MRRLEQAVENFYLSPKEELANETAILSEAKTMLCS